MIVPLSQNRVGRRMIGFDVVAFYLLHDLVGFADLLVFDVKHRVDGMFALEQTKAILQPKSGENSAVAECALAIEVEFGGPPGGCAIFKLDPIGVEVSASALCGEIGEVLDLQAARFLEVVIVGNEVGALLSLSGKSQRKQRHCRQYWPTVPEGVRNCFHRESQNTCRNADI